MATESTEEHKKQKPWQEIFQCFSVDSMANKSLALGIEKTLENKILCSGGIQQWWNAGFEEAFA
jgi:hypothetical protein